MEQENGLLGFEEPEDNKARRVEHKNVSKSPLDESGFFKKGKHDEKIIRDFTCGCEEHSSRVINDIFDAGVKQPKQIAEVFFRYKDLALKIHSAKIEVPRQNDEKTIFEKPNNGTR